MVLNDFFTPDWLTAIGTIGAVFVALFLQPIKRCIYRPKIKVDFQKKTPYLEKVEASTKSSSADPRLVIRMSIKNEGRGVADYSTINIDEYYVKQSKGTSYIQKTFTPKLIKDCNGVKLTTIAPHLTYYIDVATIQKFNGISEEGKGTGKQLYKLFLLGDGKTIQLGRGMFIVPIKFYSSKTNVVITYLSLYWESDDFTQDKEVLSVKIMSKNEFRKISIEK